MKEVCRDCKWEKPKRDNYCYCLKYGCDIRYGRTYCVAYEKKAEDRETDQRVFDRYRRDFWG